MIVQPLRDFVVVTKNEAKKQTASGIYLADLSEDKVVSGVVKSVGSGQISAEGKSIPLEVRVGDTVFFNKNLAVELKVEDETFLVLREENLLCFVRS